MERKQMPSKGRIVQSTPKEPNKSGQSGGATSNSSKKLTYKTVQSDRLKVINIIQKLKGLECPLVCNKEDAWVEEILFKPNFERYSLIEWIFSKLEFNTSKKLEFSIAEEDEFQSSSEVKVKNILRVVSTFGLCSKDRYDIIEGVAPFIDQLKFWRGIVEILWKKCSYSLNRSDSLSSPSSSKGSDSILKHYELHKKYINKVCETANLGHLFKENMEIFPKPLLDECKDSTSKFNSRMKLQSLKALAEEKHIDKDLNELCKLSFFEQDEVSCDESAYQNEELDEIEYEINSSLCDLQLHSNVHFEDAYNNLKQYLNVPTDESIDVGSSFQTANKEAKRLLQLKEALSTLKSSESEIKTLNKELQSFEMPSYSMSDSLLRDFKSV